MKKKITAILLSATLMVAMNTNLIAFASNNINADSKQEVMEEEQNLENEALTQEPVEDKNSENETLTQEPVEENKISENETLTQEPVEENKISENETLTQETTEKTPEVAEKVVTEKPDAKNAINETDELKTSVDFTISKITEKRNVNVVSEEDKPFSTTVSQEKTDSNAGMYELVFSNTQKMSLAVENDQINTSDSERPDDFTVVNGKIVSAEPTTFMTLGGTDKIIFMYPTLEDAKNKSNGVVISGAANDGSYLETTEANGEYYAHIEISGFNGYMNVQDIQIIPAYFEKAKTYYSVNSNQELVLNEAVDVLNSSEYTSFVISKAPEDFKQNEKYYTTDNINYTTDKTNNNSRSVANPTTQEIYFQNLPFRSSSDYSAQQYKNYLTNAGKTNSQYYNATQAFVDSQTMKQTNSLFMFAFANHEGAFGTSSFSKTCNNFYGRGAYDSNPGNACVEYSFPTPRDGILAQSIFLQNQYGNVDWWGYYGSHPGNKSSGMNVKYATDANWGIKIAGHMYRIDSYLGSKEYNKFRIAKMNNTTTGVHKTSALNDYIRTDTNNNVYWLKNNEGKTSSKLNVLITEESGGASKIMLDTPTNLGGSATYSSRLAKKGSYPNYQSKNFGSGHVKNGAASAYVQYQDLSKQQGWISRNSYTLINNAAPKSPTNEPGGNSNPVTGPHVRYTGHSKNIGWSPTVGDSQVAGTTGKSAPLESFKLQIDNALGYKIVAAVHVQDKGWIKYDNVSSGTILGTTGQAKSIEAISLNLEGLPGYKLQYSTHVSNVGWQDWRDEGHMSGTTSLGLSVEAVKIRLVKENGLKQEPYISYKTHVKNIGWMNSVNQGGLAGTTGKGLTIEALTMQLSNVSRDATIKGRVHVSNIGWINLNDIKMKTIVGTTGRNLNIEAIDLELVNVPGYKIEYKTHLSNVGWQNWTSNVAGSTGKNTPLEAIYMRIVKK